MSPIPGLKEIFEHISDSTLTLFTSVGDHDAANAGNAAAAAAAVAHRSVEQQQPDANEAVPSHHFSAWQIFLIHAPFALLFLGGIFAPLFLCLRARRKDRLLQKQREEDKRRQQQTSPLPPPQEEVTDGSHVDVREIV